MSECKNLTAPETHHDNDCADVGKPGSVGLESGYGTPDAHTSSQAPQSAEVRGPTYEICKSASNFGPLGGCAR
jgi:hypothetical protein